jgi:hypothetical protein
MSKISPSILPTTTLFLEATLSLNRVCAGPLSRKLADTVSPVPQRFWRRSNSATRATAASVLSSPPNHHSLILTLSTRLGLVTLPRSRSSRPTTPPPICLDSAGTISASFCPSSPTNFSILFDPFTRIILANMPNLSSRFSLAIPRTTTFWKEPSASSPSCPQMNRF